MKKNVESGERIAQARHVKFWIILKLNKLLLKCYTSIKEISTTQDVISRICRCIVQNEVMH